MNSTPPAPSPEQTTSGVSTDHPGVNLTSVTATSLMGQLDCSITDAGGATIAAQATNTMITTCTK